MYRYEILVLYFFLFLFYFQQPLVHQTPRRLLPFWPFNPRSVYQNRPLQQPYCQCWPQPSISYLYPIVTTQYNDQLGYQNQHQNPTDSSNVRPVSPSEDHTGLDSKVNSQYVLAPQPQQQQHQLSQLSSATQQTNTMSQINHLPAPNDQTISQQQVLPQQLIFPNTGSSYANNPNPNQSNSQSIPTTNYQSSAVGSDVAQNSQTK